MRQVFAAALRVGAWVALGSAFAMPLAGDHPGHGHDGVLGGAQHVWIELGAWVLLIASLAIAVASARRRVD